MHEFTFDTFSGLLRKFISVGYTISTFRDFISKPPAGKTLVLRHDVDRFPSRSLRMAQLEAELRICATYFFRTRAHTFLPQTIRKIEELGHEIGYHYENLSDKRGDLSSAIDDFSENLIRLRDVAQVATICMHGSPLSTHDNKDLWSHASYRDYGIIADTSLDVDYDKVFYISDNGWGWNRTQFSVRDKVESSFDITIDSTLHLHEMLDSDQLPNFIMLNAHPDSFNDFGFLWFLNYAFINSKNLLKRGLIYCRSK